MRTTVLAYLMRKEGVCAGRQDIFWGDPSHEGAHGNPWLLYNHFYGGSGFGPPL